MIYSIIVVTGTPGTGKTTVAKRISKKYNLRYVDVNSLIKKHNLSIGRDEERDCEIVDEKKLVLYLIDLIRKFKLIKKSRFKGIIIDSHLSHYLPKYYVDHCIVTKCSLRILNERLKERGYNKQKIKENLDAEIFDTCRVEAYEKGHNVSTIITDTERDAIRGIQKLHATPSTRIARATSASRV